MHWVSESDETCIAISFTLCDQWLWNIATTNATEKPQKAPKCELNLVMIIFKTRSELPMDKRKKIGIARSYFYRHPFVVFSKAKKKQYDHDVRALHNFC